MSLLTFEKIRQISETSQASMVEHFEEHFDPLLELDVSNYARGRRRMWLEAEPTLVRNFTLKTAHHDSRTWNWLLKHVWPSADLGLISRGPVGISLHRDATYAGWTAYGVNLGEPTVFGYEEIYEQYGYGPCRAGGAPVTEITLEPGDVYRFNPKNRHGVLSEITAARWNINLWTLKK